MYNQSLNKLSGVQKLNELKQRASGMNDCLCCWWRILVLTHEKEQLDVLEEDM